jgi:PPOX class probable F420-dependent enzyme
MDLKDAMTHVAAGRQGVLIAHRKDGRSQPSNIAYWVGDDGVIRISITDTRAKTKNLRRDPRCELYIVGDNFWKYLVLDAECELSPVTTEPNDATADELVEYYRAVSGEHPNWDEYRRAMVDDQRLIARLRPSRAFGMWRES